MAGRSWRETAQALGALLPTIAAHDTNGIDLYFLNHKSADLGVPSEPRRLQVGFWLLFILQKFLRRRSRQHQICQVAQD
jgi:hypothetical protein